MPQVTEYSCRLKNPKRFQQASFRRIESGDVDLIIARPYGKRATRAQAIRYPRELWDKESAKRSCKKRKGTFEPVKSQLGATRKKASKSRYPYYPYDVMKHGKEWIMIGHTSGKYWMQIGSGYRTKKEAIARAKHQIRADKAARQEVLHWEV